MFYSALQTKNKIKHTKKVSTYWVRNVRAACDERVCASEYASNGCIAPPAAPSPPNRTGTAAP